MKTTLVELIERIRVQCLGISRCGDVRLPHEMVEAILTFLRSIVALTTERDDANARADGFLKRWEEAKAETAMWRREAEMAGKMVAAQQETGTRLRKMLHLPTTAEDSYVVEAVQSLWTEHCDRVVQPKPMEYCECDYPNVPTGRLLYDANPCLCLRCQKVFEYTRRSELFKARAIAWSAHAGQYSKYQPDEPYILHVQRVVNLCATDDERIVAWLHDVLEDCPQWTSQRLEEAGIAKAHIGSVLQLSRSLASSTHSWAPPPYEDYIMCVLNSGDSVAIKVKIADLKDHLRPGCPERLRPRYEAALACIEHKPIRWFGPCEQLTEEQKAAMLKLDMTTAWIAMVPMPVSTDQDRLRRLEAATFEFGERFSSEVCRRKAAEAQRDALVQCVDELKKGLETSMIERENLKSTLSKLVDDWYQFVADMTGRYEYSHRLLARDYTNGKATGFKSCARQLADFVKGLK